MAKESRLITPVRLSEDEPTGSFRFEYIRIEHGHRPLPWGERAQWIPVMDLYGNERCVVLEVHIPDVAPDAVRVEYEANRIRISGVRNDVSLTGRREFYHVEIPRGDFHRDIALPDGLDVQKSEISIERGVLRMVLPWINRDWAVAVRKTRFPEEWS